MSADNEKIIDIQFDNAPQTIDIDFDNDAQVLEADFDNDAQVLEADFDNDAQVLEADFGNVQQITVGNVSVSLEETDEGVVITAWDAEGEETALVRHGKDGRDGDPGQPGADGISPVVTVQDITGGHRVTITDKDGAKVFDVMDGTDGTGGSGGAQVQADWAVNDPDNPAYVQNRTHYEIYPEFEPIHWDGDMTGRLALDLSMIGYPSGQYFVKVSDMVPLAEDLIDGAITYTFSNTGQIKVLKIDAENIDDVSFPGCISLDDLVNIVYDADTLSKALGIPSGIYTNGIYFIIKEGSMYVSSMETKTKHEIKKIDQKFLPDAVQPDWSQYDETKPDFVKNRTHYEVPDVYDITWDGDATGRPALDISSVVGVTGAKFVKVSDRVYTKDELDWKRAENNQNEGYRVGKNNLLDAYPGAFVDHIYTLAVVYDENAFNEALGLPEKAFTNGTYFLSYPGGFIKSLYSEGYVVKLEEKYLPDNTLRRVLFDEVFMYCKLDGGWSSQTWDMNGMTIPEAQEMLCGNIIETRVHVAKGQFQQQFDIAMMFGNTNSTGTAFGRSVESYVTSEGEVIVEVYLRIDFSYPSTVSVSAKTLTI